MVKYAQTIRRQKPTLDLDKKFFMLTEYWNSGIQNQFKKMIWWGNTLI